MARPRPSRSRRKARTRRSGQRSRAAIIEAARSRFARDGYDATTIRGVAAGAGVDPALVMQFYGNKEGLFAAVLEQQAPDAGSMFKILNGPRAGLGERFTRAYLELWESPIAGKQLRSMVRAGIGSPRATSRFKTYLAATWAKSEIPPDRRLRYLLAVSHLFGVAVARYIIEVPLLAAPSLDELVRLLSPAIETYLNPASGTALARGQWTGR
jgi:AcrR family transcriptional regulator